jgi:hypothetical protein
MPPIKPKVDNSLLKRLQQRENREKRKESTKTERQKILIVCEGEKTEPNYFRSVERMLPKGIVSIEIIGTGSNTISVVKTCLEQIKKAIEVDEKYDEAWVVFDKDSFSNEHFNEAIRLAEANKVNCAFSNEAFELWYILHFQYLVTKLNREQYNEILAGILGCTYEKNSIDIIEVILKKGNVDTAIRNAKTLEKTHDNTNHAIEVPKTLVYKLVEKLLAYKS